MGNYHLLGDSAYISNDDSAFILTHKRDNGTLTPADNWCAGKQQNQKR